MNKLEKILLLILGVFALINIWIENNEITMSLFGFTFLVFSLIYLIFGFYIFNLNIPSKINKLISILNGIFIAGSFYVIAVKFYQPTIKYNIIIILIPLFLITLFYGFKAFYKSSTNETPFFKKLFQKNLIYFLCFILIVISPATFFAKVIYGKYSSQHNQALQLEYLSDAQAYRQNEKIQQAEFSVKKALEYSEMHNDRSSALYQECLNELGSIYYEKGNYHEADSVFNLVIELYNFEDFKKIKENYSKDYQDEYFYAIFTKAQVNSSWGDYGTADSLYKIALHYYTNYYRLAYIYTDLGYINSMSGNFEIADSLLYLSLDFHEKTGIGNKHNYLSTLLELTQNYIKSSRYSSADSILKQSLTFAKTEFGLQDINVANVLDIYVVLNIKRALFDEAEKYCLQSLKIKETAIGKKHANYLVSKIDLASIYISKSKYKEAEFLLKELENTIEKNYNAKNSISIKLYDVLNQYYEDFMFYDKAQKYGEKSLEGRIYSYGKYNINTAISYHNLASTYYYQHKYNISDSLFNLALIIREHYSGVESSEYLSSLNGISLIYMEKDSLKLVEEWLNYCLETHEEKYGINHPNYAILLSNIAAMKIKQSLYSDAEKKLFSALKIYNNIFHEKHLKIAGIYYDLGLLQNKKGNTKQAFDYFTKSVSIYESLLGNSHFYVNQKKDEINKYQSTQLKI